jgi:hypothetical protein
VITSPHSFPVADNIITINITDALLAQQHSSFHIVVNYNPLSPQPGNENFNTLSVRPDCYFSWTGRSQAVIDLYQTNKPGAPAVYDPTVDACRVTLAQDQTNLRQLRFPILQSDKIKTTIIYEFMFSSNWIRLA